MQIVFYPNGLDLLFFGPLISKHLIKYQATNLAQNMFQNLIELRINNITNILTQLIKELDF